MGVLGGGVDRQGIVTCSLQNSEVNVLLNQSN